MRHRSILAGAALSCLGAVGCAKSPTSILTLVDADPSAPPILILRTVVARVSDPSMVSYGQQASPNTSDAAGRPGPYGFPFALDLTVDPSFAGPVTVTIEGIDWDTYAVIASGSTTADVTAQQQTHASVTLFPIGAGAGDGGTDGDGPSDAGAD
jgi:hypothetical protein